jgi:hypothetical protein
MRDVATRAVSSTYYANFTWPESVRVSFTYRLNSSEETSPPCATPARMPRHVDVADWKEAWNAGNQRFHQVRWEV